MAINSLASSIYQKISELNFFEWVVLVVYIAMFGFLFSENFIFSSSIDLLAFREIDDVAFQDVLREFHSKITNVEITSLFTVNRYGYGWIFWFPMIVISYPFYLLSYYFGFDAPLLALPRQISLLYSFATAYLLLRITSIYTGDRFIRALVLLLFISFPVVGYFSLRFGTVSQNMFFCALTFYLTCRKQQLSRRDLMAIVLSLAAAAGTKMSGLLISPVIGCMLADRFGWTLSKTNIKHGFYFLTIFGLAAIFFINPSLYLVLIYPEALRSIKDIGSLMLKTQTDFGGSGTLTERFVYGIASGTTHVWIFFTMLLGLFLATLRNNTLQGTKKRDLLYILVGIIIATGYLILRIKMGIIYISIYFTTLCFLVPLGMICLSNIHKKYQYILGIGLVSLSIFLNWNYIWGTQLRPNNYAINAYYQKQMLPDIIRQLELQQNLQAKLAQFSEQAIELNIITDYQLPPIYSQLRDNIKVKTVFDNIQVSGHSVDSYDLIGISKGSVAFLPADQFNQRANQASAEIANRYREHRSIVREILETKQYRGSHYSILFENEDAVVLINRQLLSS